MLSARLTDPTHRSRSAAALFAGVALSAMGYTILVTFLPLVSEDLLGNPRWSGAPSAFGTIGTAFGTTWLSRLILRRGRRNGLVLGYLFAGGAAVLAGLAAVSSVFPLLAIGLFGIGAGYASARLSRYAAAALFEPTRRSAAIGWNVWAATLGAVVGPLLLAPIRSGSEGLGLPGFLGPFLTTGLAFGAAGIALAILFPPGSAAMAESASGALGDAPAKRFVWPESARLALVALATGQVVMVLIMTMTPIHVRAGGHGLHSVGVVMASHTFGMYAISPIAGYLSDRMGRVPMIAAAVICLVASGILAARAEPGSPWLAVALLLLGLGWCFGFVSASALLTESTPQEHRVRVQGLADSIVWGSAALAQLGSGLFLAAFGYPALSLAGSTLALAPLLFWRRARS
jgi:MFS family permease